MLMGFLSGVVLSIIVLIIVLSIILTNQDYKIELMQEQIDYLTKQIKKENI